MTETTPSYFN